jgi:hypothetical protein
MQSCNAFGFAALIGADPAALDRCLQRHRMSNFHHGVIRAAPARHPAGPTRKRHRIARSLTYLFVVVATRDLSLGVLAGEPLSPNAMPLSTVLNRSDASYACQERTAGKRPRSGRSAWAIAAMGAGNPFAESSEPSLRIACENYRRPTRM